MGQTLFTDSVLGPASAVVQAVRLTGRHGGAGPNLLVQAQGRRPARRGLARFAVLFLQRFAALTAEFCAPNITMAIRTDSEFPRSKGLLLTSNDDEVTEEFPARPARRRKPRPALGEWMAAATSGIESGEAPIRLLPAGPLPAGHGRLTTGVWFP